MLPKICYIHVYFFLQLAKLLLLLFQVLTDLLIQPSGIYEEKFKVSISNQSKNVSKSISIEEKQTKIQFKTVGTSSLLLLTITWWCCKLLNNVTQLQSFRSKCLGNHCIQSEISEITRQLKTIQRHGFDMSNRQLMTEDWRRTSIGFYIVCFFDSLSCSLKS